MSNAVLEQQIKSIANEIYNIECPILNIEDRTGYTGYIDFIKPTEFNDAFVKGTDRYKRKFVVFRAKIVYDNNEVATTFTTLFQRYLGDETLWMTTNIYTYLFDTSGGIDLHQLGFAFKLLTEKTVYLTEDMEKNFRIVNRSSSEARHVLVELFEVKENEVKEM